MELEAREHRPRLQLSIKSQAPWWPRSAYVVVSATGGNLDLSGKATGGRKLIAVVFADMVGYSRLIGLDDAATLHRLRTLRRALYVGVVTQSCEQHHRLARAAPIHDVQISHWERP